MDCEVCGEPLIEKNENELLCEDCKKIYISLDELEEKYQGEKDV